MTFRHSYMIGSRITQKVLNIYQPEEVSIYQEKIWFLGYMMSSKGICMEDKKIKTVKQWLKSKSV